MHVANHKAAWYDFDEAMDIPSFSGSGGTTPQSSSRRNKDVTGPSRQQLVIDPGPRMISGTNVSGKKYRLDGGNFFGKPVSLGEVRTDDAGRLVVLGGHGISASKDKTPASPVQPRQTTRRHPEATPQSWDHRWLRVRLALRCAVRRLVVHN